MTYRVIRGRNAWYVIPTFNYMPTSNKSTIL